MLWSCILSYCCSGLSLKFRLFPAHLSVFSPKPKCYDTLPLVTVLKKKKKWQNGVVETDPVKPESGSAIVVFTCTPNYCMWHSLPPIAFRYLRRLSNILLVRLSLSEREWFILTVCNMLNVYICCTIDKEGEYLLRLKVKNWIIMWMREVCIAQNGYEFNQIRGKIIKRGMICWKSCVNVLKLSNLQYYIYVF